LKVSGFTFARNAVRLRYPLAESIRSALPLVDEMVVNVGRSDDGTLELVRGIGDPRIVLVESVWDEASLVRGRVLAEQTDIALEHCTGDTCLYLQADEVFHEEDHPRIRDALARMHADPGVEGLAFRAGPGVRVFHYGWVRPPAQQTEKMAEFERLYQGDEARRRRLSQGFSYDVEEKVRPFEGTHPAPMAARVAAEDWVFEPRGRRIRPGHLREDLLDLFEAGTGIRIGEYRNFEIVR